MNGSYLPHFSIAPFPQYLSLSCPCQGGVQPDFDFQKWEDLDSNYLQQRWEWRQSVSGFEMVAGLLTSIGWFCLIPPIWSFAYLQSRGGRNYLFTHIAMALLVLGGSFFEAIDTLETIGTQATCNWLANDFHLDFTNGDGWRTLEITFLANQGSRLWIDAVDWLFLSGVLALIYSSATKASTEYPVAWARFGAVIAVFSFLDFVAECGRFAASFRTFSAVSGVFSAINTIILLPIWMLWFGCLLPGSRTRAFVGLDETTGSSGGGVLAVGL